MQGNAMQCNAGKEEGVLWKCAGERCSLTNRSSMRLNATRLALIMVGIINSHLSQVLFHLWLGLTPCRLQPGTVSGRWGMTPRKLFWKLTKQARSVRTCLLERGNVASCTTQAEGRIG